MPGGMTYGGAVHELPSAVNVTGRGVRRGRAGRREGEDRVQPSPPVWRHPS